MLNKLFLLLVKPDLREAVAKILDVLESWLRGETSAETAVKQIINIVLELLMPGENVEVEIVATK